ncbi:MAG: twin transmembrane helix small protein [Betaproteobacteria bacterium]|jgi:hypothetical protein|nr:twin transmembrane helix small protein [Betaproteobacteria bacterium]
MTFFIALAFLGILASLATALFFMVRNKPENDDSPKASPMAKALAFRIGISVVLFIGILLSWKMGWIHPSGIPLTPN